MMRGLDRGDRRLAGLHAVNEVAMVVVGLVELHLVAVVRDFANQSSVGGVIAAAVHPDPAVGADPFRAAANVVIAAGDDHGDVLGVLQLDAIFGAGVPDGVGGRELAVAFDLRGAAVVHVHAPMGDVAVVADPVQQLAAAGVVVPAPVHVHARLDVRLHPGRADPHLVIQLGRRRRHGDLPVRAAGHDFGQILGVLGRLGNFASRAGRCRRNHDGRPAGRLRRG